MSTEEEVEEEEEKRKIWFIMLPYLQHIEIVNTAASWLQDTDRSVHTRIKNHLKSSNFGIKWDEIQICCHGN